MSQKHYPLLLEEGQLQEVWMTDQTEEKKEEGIMKNLRVTIKDDSGKECSIENIRTFQKHLQLFHKKGNSIHDDTGLYFTVDDSFRQKIDTLVRELSG